MNVRSVLPPHFTPSFDMKALAEDVRCASVRAAMTPDQIADSIRQQLAEKERTDLDQLGRAQTPGGTMTDDLPEPSGAPHPIVAYVAKLERRMRERCLLQGCYYGLATQSDVCVYCGTPRQTPPLGVSPIESAKKDIR